MTQDTGGYSRARSRLEDAGFRVRAKAINRVKPLDGRVRGMIGSVGENPTLLTTWYLYVEKRQVEEARDLLRREAIR